jgi:crossover junction endodeoxyribonuclease RusA
MNERQSIYFQIDPDPFRLVIDAETMTTLATLSIFLPWPDSDLNPNARPSRWQKTAAKQQVKSDAFFCAKQALDAQPSPFNSDQPIKYFLSFTPPDNRYRMDDDNAIATMKASLDGIAAALEVDDKIFQLAGIVWNLPKKPGSVEVVLKQTSVRNDGTTPIRAPEERWGRGEEVSNDALNR